MNGSAYYSLAEMAQLLGKSANVLYRRLTEKPKRYVLKFSVKVGNEWKFNKKLVDEAIDKNEPIYSRLKGQNDGLDSRIRELFYR